MKKINLIDISIQKNKFRYKIKKSNLMVTKMNKLTSLKRSNLFIFLLGLVEIYFCSTFNLIEDNISYLLLGVNLSLITLILLISLSNYLTINKNTLKDKLNTKNKIINFIYNFIDLIIVLILFFILIISSFANKNITSEGETTQLIIFDTTTLFLAIPLLICFLIKYFLSTRFLNIFFDKEGVNKLNFSFIFKSYNLNLNNDKEYKLNGVSISLNSFYVFIYVTYLYILFKLMLVNVGIFSSNQYIDIYVILGLYLLNVIFYIIKISKLNIYNKLYVIYSSIHYLFLFIFLLISVINLNINITNINNDKSLFTIILMSIYILIKAIIKFIVDNHKVNKINKTNKYTY